MIFTLSATVEDLDALPSEECEQLFLDLVNASLKGRHMVIFQRFVCTWVLSNLQLSKHQLAHVSLLRERFTGLGRIAEIANAHCLVSIGDQRLSFDGQKCFMLGHRQLLSSGLVDRRSSLVVEDAHSDGQFYFHVLTEARKLTLVPGCDMELVHGGGAPTYRAFEREFQKPAVVVCIVDTDQKAPSGAQSETCRAVLRVRDANANSILGNAYASQGSEVENILSFDLLRGIKGYSSHPAIKQIQSLLDRIEDAETKEEFWSYFDIKHGLDGAEISSKVVSGDLPMETKTWMLKVLNMNEEEFAALRIDGLGNRTIEQFLNCGATLAKFHTLCRTPKWRGKYLNYFENILWYFCAPEQSRT